MQPLVADGLHHLLRHSEGPASESGTESLASLASYSSCYQARIGNENALVYVVFQK
jgi:hypothetical protein